MNNIEQLRKEFDKVPTVSIYTNGGYTFEQVMNNLNCSKDPKYWNKIEGTNKYLFKSSIAESFEYFYPELVNPIKNTNQIYLRFLNSFVFTKEANRFKQDGYYVRGREGILSFDQYWNEQEELCENGLEVDGVRITGRHYFALNFGRIDAVPTDHLGNATSKTKIDTFLRFLDHQYYLAIEIEECLLEGPYISKERYFNYFPLKTNKDFNLLKKKGFVAVKSRRKGFSYIVDNLLYAYNFTFIAYSNNFLFAYESGQYGTTLKGIHNTLNFLNKHTEFGRRRAVLNTKEHFRASYSYTDENGVSIEEGYMSEIEAKSFKDNVFKAIGSSAYLIGIEESGRFHNLIDAYGVSIEPLIRDGENWTGTFVSWGCIMKDYKVWDGTGNLVNIQDLNPDNKIIGFDNGVSLEPVTNYHSKPIVKPCYELLTDTGYKLGCSDDHPILCGSSKFTKRETINGKRIVKEGAYKRVYWKDAKDIKVGDQIAIIDKVDIFGGQEMWEPRVIGMLIGDGSYGVDCATVLHNADSEILDYVSNKFKTSFSKSSSYITKDGRLYKALRLNGIVPKLRELGIYGQTKSNKRLPVDIFKCNKHSVTELIAGLFDTDGEVIVNKRKWLNINLNAAHIEIIEEVKFLLSKIGVHGSITFVKPRLNKKSGFSDVNGYYRLSISDYKSVINFYENIKLLVRAKQDKLNLVEEYKHLHKAQLAYKIVETSKVKGKKNYDVKELSNIRFNTVKDIKYIGEQEVYNLTANATNTYIASNIITHNSAGDMDSGGSAGLKDFAYKPNAYNIKSYKNIYEPEERLQEVCWFIADSWYAPSVISKEDFLDLLGKKNNNLKELIENKYDETIIGVDIQGNSHHWIAEVILHNKRDKLKSNGSSKAYQKLMTQQPLYLSEAFLMNEGSPFEVAIAQQALADLESESPSGIPTVFTINRNGEVEMVYDTSLKQVDEYPIQDDKQEGCWIIYSKPEKTEGIGYHRFISSCDPIDFGYDEVSDSGKHSMAVAWIADLFTKQIVAVYAGRPAKAEQFYEQLWRGIEFYDAQLLYENNLKGLYSYFASKNKLYLLADELTSLKDRWGYKSNNRLKGFHATAAINAYARSLINRWTMEEFVIGYTDEGEPIKTLRMFTIKSKALLKQLISWNSFDNFDWVSAFMGLMLIMYDKESLVEDSNTRTTTRVDSEFFQKVRDKYVKSSKVWNSIEQARV